MAVATPTELQDLITSLNDAAKSYNPAQSLDGFKTRVEIIDNAKKIVRSMSAPADMGFYHSISVRPNQCCC
jgi:hypothetical protein